jgi:hypothetical protein
MTIHNLEVRLEVEGEGDEAVFGRLFQKYMRLWSREEAEQRTRRRLAERERSLGDRPMEDQV